MTLMPPHTPLTLPPSIPPFLAPYLPPASPRPRPFLTLTYATSLDSHLSVAQGTQTALSGAESKALTHYLRTRHAGILIGVSTAIADDPGLNARLPDANQPRPIVLDPNFRWRLAREARVLQTAREGRGKAPWILVSRAAWSKPDERERWLQECGGMVVVLDPPGERGWAWEYLLDTLGGLGLESVMVEGGGRVINDLLREEGRVLVDAVVVTVAPVYLGKGGVNVSPDVKEPVRFRDVEWAVLGRDVVMAARVD